MTISELISKLQQFPQDMEVYDYSLDPIEKVSRRTWVHTNYPYNLPDKEIVVLE